MRRYLFAILSLVGTAAFAQGFRDTDKFFDVDGLTTVLSGQVIEFYDGSLASYGVAGDYEFAYAPGEPPFRGIYEIGDRGEVCVDFDNGFGRCDTYVRSTDRIILVIEDGQRFPVKSVQPIN
ncbi:MAG: hypothetical protein AAF667_07295 [Pseudomonadota bacterium]